MVTLNKRQKDILNFLELKDEYITIKYIADLFDVSSRTVRNDLNTIEELIKQSNITLEKKPSVGIRLNLKNNQSIKTIIEDNKVKVYSPEERVVISILMLIIKGKVTIEELSNDTFVSKNTLVQDFKQVVSKLKEYDIEVSKKIYYGITINDDEEKIRNTFLSIFGKLDNELKNDVIKRLKIQSRETDSTIKSDIYRIEKEIGTTYSQESIEELEMMVLLSKCRFNKGLHIQYSEKEKKYLMFRREFNILKSIFNLNDDEICYLLKIVDGLRRTIGGEVNDITKEILDRFCQVLDIDCSKDLEFTSKIAMHLKVAIHRIKNNLVIENPMLEEIKYKMSFIYKITKQILKEKQDIIGVKFPEEEVAYMAMYFDAIFERNVKFKFTYKILIVCNGGLATSSLLKARINIMVPEAEITGVCRLGDLDAKLKEEDVDLIVSTIPAKINGYKVIQVNPLLDNCDAEKIKLEIYNKRYEKNCKYLIDAVKGKEDNKLTKLFPQNFTQINIDINDWRSAIKIAAKPLVENNKITKQYTNEIIKVVENLGNYMVFIPKIAFVHATKDNVLENSMSLLTLKSEINFGSKNQVPVKVIVVLANKNENMNLVNLINILTRDDNVEKLKNVINYDDIKNIT